MEEKVQGPRNCQRCSRETHNYWICNQCTDEKLAEGANIDDLYEVEEDQYVLAGLAKLSRR